MTAGFVTGPGPRRRAEAKEGVDHLMAELDGWLLDAGRFGPPGAHETRLELLREIVVGALGAVRADFACSTPGDESDDYAAASVLDRRVVACRRLVRWYVLRFGQRAEPHVRDCVLGADEVVWSLWTRTFAAARTPAPTAAPLCFVDDDPVPWASLHAVMPAEARPPSRDSVLSRWISRLPVPVIGLPPVVLRRPWWLVTAVHETGHHVQQAFDVVDGVRDALAAATRDAGADAGEQHYWGECGREVFADAFAAALVGWPSVWAVRELERAEPDRCGARSFYPPIVVRHALASAVVAWTGAGDDPSPGPAVDADPDPAARRLLGQVPAVVDAVLDHPLGRTTLRTLGIDGGERAAMQDRWARALTVGIAQPDPRVGAAEACVGGAVLAWSRAEVDAAKLRSAVLDVLPRCSPPGTRAGEDPAIAPAVRMLAGDLLSGRLE